MTLIPRANGSVLQVTKGKKARFNIYAGISQNYLVLSECEKYKHYYAFDEVYNLHAADLAYLTMKNTAKRFCAFKSDTFVVE